MNHLPDDARTIRERLLEFSRVTGDCPSIETIRRVLAGSSRADALLCLVAAEGPLTVEALANALSARDSTDRETEELIVSLYHRDLPMLADAGLVTFDPREDRVAATAVASAVADAISGLVADLA